APGQRLEILARKALEGQHLRTGKKRGVELETGIFRGRADENDRAVFHHRQEAVLLGAVEAMDFIDEQQGTLPGAAGGTGCLENLLEISHARKDRRNLLEAIVGG